MNCWHCGTELIWGGDHDTEDNEEYDIVTNLSCPNCHSAVDVYHPSEQLIKEYKKYEKNKKISTRTNIPLLNVLDELVMEKII